MDQSEQARIEQLERLISELRHDLRGAVSPALLIADRLMRNGDPVIQRSGNTIQAVVERVLKILESTAQAVPPRSGPH